MLKRVLLACIPASAALLAAGTPPASAADACISPKVTEALAACGGATPGPSPARRTPVTVGQVAPPAAKSAQKPLPPDAALSAVELRRGLANLQSVQLLITQLQGLETLLGNTPSGSADRPGLLRRLADGYVELETASFRKKTESRMRADESKRKDPGKAAGFSAEAQRAEKVEVAARQAAIKHYVQLRSQYPRWCQSPGQSPATASGCADETLYNLAYEHEQAGDLNQARAAYLDLIQTAPTSKYVPTAYLAFGELFFQEAQGDPAKWALAEQSYREVIRYPAPENKVLGYAHYKLAYVYWNKGDLVAALTELKRTIDVGAQFPTLPNAAQLAVSARRDLVPLYAQSGDPRKAHDFFRPLSGDGAGETARTFRLMGELGQSYLDVGRFHDGIELYQDLLRRDRGDRSCEYQAHVTEATLALKTGDKAAAKSELDRLLLLEQRFRGEAHPDEAKATCASLTAAHAVETAMIWHLEAVGSGNVRGTGSAETMAATADLYDRVVKQFSAAQFARFEFPRVVKQDWPTLLKVKAARADLLYAQKDWPRCGAAFDAVVEEEPRGPLAAESAYASALCYQKAYLAAHEGGSARVGLHASSASAVASRELAPLEKAMLASFDRFLCIARADPTDKAAYDNYVEVEYARARTYFDAHHWPEAAAAFRGVALARADHELGAFASQLYLEALNVMTTHGSPACVEDMGKDLPLLVERYCGGQKAGASAEQCGTLAKIQRDVDWQRVDGSVKQIGDAQGPEHAREWEQAAEAYLHIWTQYGREACLAKQPACERMDQVLYNAARAFQAARLVAKAIAVRKILLEPRYNLDRTALSQKTVYEIGGNYQAIAVYEDAGTWYERFAHDSPGNEKAPAALQDAIVLRLGLGQEEQAIRDADLFDRTYRARHPALAAQIAFAVGVHYAEHDEYEKARRRLTAAMGDIDRSGTIDVQIQAHAMLGRVLARGGGEAGAATEYARVRSLFKDPQAVLAKVNAGGGDEGQQGRRAAKLLTAVGEAIFFSAEQKRRAVEGLKFPAYTGSGRREDVLAHIRGKVAAWAQKKQPAIEEAEREYRKILDVQPAAPPRWVIASGERVGQMWGRFVAEFRAAPIPREWRQHGPSPYGDLTWEEILAAYLEGIDKASEPYRLRAKVAYQACLTYSSTYQYFDDHSRSCEKWLSRNYSAEFHVMDELRGAPSRLAARIDGQPALLAP
jgi:TolA-binding protein